MEMATITHPYRTHITKHKVRHLTLKTNTEFKRLSFFLSMQVHRLCVQHGIGEAQSTPFQALDDQGSYNKSSTLL